MKLFQRILSNLSFFIAVMLLFLLFFQNKVSLPPVFQAIGRMHLMLLHLPIGLLSLVLVLWLFRKKDEENSFQENFTLILHVTVFTAALTALMGFFLSKEDGYDEIILNRHKLLGVATAILVYFLLIIYRAAPEKKKLFGTTLIATALSLVAGSHFGSNLTHGEGYVWQPLRGEEEMQEEKITDSSSLFTAAIRPILKTKCFSCHNEKKAKGELVMTSVEKLMKGGKNGPIWKAGDAQNSHIIKNINLPEEEKKHMPPKGKPQLTPEEAQFLYSWIQAGADMLKQLREYPDTDSLKIFASRHIRLPQEEAKEKEYPFAAATVSDIQKMNGPFCSVFPLSQKSPALQADFFVREKFDRKKLEGLLKVKEQLVVLNLGNMPVADADMKTVSKFGNLEKLILNNSSITNKGLAEIAGMKNLQSLSLAGTRIDKNALITLSKTDSLKEVFIWNTGITTEDIASIKQKNKKIIFNAGYIPDKNEMLVLTAPAIKNESVVLSAGEAVELKHQVPGVIIRYTTDGSVPDSTTSPVYKTPISINGFTTIKARAIKSGWYSSPVAEFSFFKKGIEPQRAELINLPNEKYKGEGATTLIDGKKGTPENFSDAAWLGFREKPFEAIFYFEKTQAISSVSISYNKNVPSYLMPPAEIELWGGPDKNKMKLLKKISLPQTTKEEKNVVRNEAIKVEISPATAHYFKILAKNLTKLPSWHPGKGDKGWLFIDEIFFN